MGEATGEFAPGSDAFCLDKFFLLRREGIRHVVESASELADFVVALSVDVRVPTAGSNIARAVGEFFDGMRDAFGHPPGEEKADEDGGEGDRYGGFQDLAAEEDEFTLRTTKEKYAEQFVVAAGERDGVESFGGGGIAGPFDGARDGFGLPLLLDRFDEGLKLVGLCDRAVRIGKRGRNKTLIEVAIKERAHAGGHNERGQEILIETAATDDVDGFVTDSLGTYGSQRESDAVRQFFALQKGGGAIPVFAGGDPVIFIADTSGILRRRDESTIGVYKFDEIEIVSLRGAVGVVQIERGIGVGAGQIENHADGNIGVGDVFNLLYDHFTALIELLFELSDEGFGALGVLLFESALRVVGDAVGDKRDGRQNGGEEDQKDFVAKAHGWTPVFRPCGVSELLEGWGPAVSSQTSARRHSPEGEADQLRTFGASPT